MKPNNEAMVGSEVKFKFNQFEVRFVKEPQDGVSQLSAQKDTNSRKKGPKTAKKIKDQPSTGKEVTF